MNMSEAIEREKKIAEIREALERAKGKHTVGTISDSWCRFLLSELLSELERLEREYAGERAAHNAHVTELEQERDKLIEGLRWYADTKNYEYRTSYIDQDAPIIDDSGQRARDILEELGVDVNEK